MKRPRWPRRRRAPRDQSDEGIVAARRRRRTSVGRHLLLVAMAYVPLVLTSPGRVAADTKTYLYLDPGRLLSRAASMWDPSIGLGTVTHQNIGYLWPMGPWYWVFERLGSPDWVSQRLWLATVMFAAGAGVLYLLRSFRWRGPGMLAAATLYMLSPYVLHYGARISVILLPWAALPWLIGLTERAVRRRTWRHPALFALVVATVGGVNATALVMAGIGPLLWLPFAMASNREITGPTVVRAAGRIGVLSLACSLWWIAGLAAQGAYGIDILRFTETVETVARTSLASEVLRGLGYWFFYGGDLLGPWIEPARSYTQELWLIAIGFAVPVVAFTAGVGIRWRHRAYFVTLLAVGTAVAVGAFPYDGPSPLGALFTDLATSSTAGLALRSTPRAVPLVALALAVLVAAGISALARRSPPLALPATLAAVLLAVAGLPPLWTGDMIGENLERPEEIPTHWHEAATWLDERGDATRVLVVPGIDFASYRWGNTVDPVLPGLMDRPMVARELIPYGSPPSADLLMALDRRFQEGILDPAALAPMARLLGAGDVLLRSDLQFERYRTPRPRALRAELTPTPTGLAEPVTFGPPAPNDAVRSIPLVDEITLATPPGAPHPAPVTIFPVKDPRPIVRVAPAGRPIILAGDGEGVVEAAAAGLLDGPGALLYDADLLDAEDLRAAMLDRGATLVLTDSNRRRARRWNTVRENVGVTEQTGEVALEATDVDQRLLLFPGAGDDTRTVVEQRGVRRVQASSYGNHISYNAEDRPAYAFDGNPTTAWRTGAFGDVIGERLLVEAESPVTTDRVGLTQTLTGARNRWITEVELRLDGEPVGRFVLTEASRTEGGQVIPLGASRTFTTLEVIVVDDSHRGVEVDGLSSAGFAEVDVAGIRVDEVVRLPRSLLSTTGEASADQPLTILLARARSDPRELYRSDEEVALSRAFELPTPRRFELTGQARLSARAPDAVIDAALGHEGLPAARSSDRIVGNIGARAASAFDGDPSTVWRPPVGEQVGRWVELESGAPMDLDGVDLTVVRDGRHSVPTRVRVVADGREVATVDVAHQDDVATEGATATTRLDLPPVRATTVRLVVEEVRVVTGTDSFSDFPHTLPVGIANISLPVRMPPTPDQVDSGCRTDLATIDGEPVSLRVTGSLGNRTGRQGLQVSGCGAISGGMDLPSGEQVLRAADGRSTGIDLDRLVLTADVPTPGVTTASPVLEVTGQGRSSVDLDVSAIDGPFWLVLGQSHNDGWAASADGLGDLGSPRILDGYANGWWVEPGDADTLSIALRWTPQRWVWLALALSALGVLLCLALAVLDRRRGDLIPDEDTSLPWQPWLDSPLTGAGGRPDVTVTAAVAVAAGAIAALLLRPWAGPLVAVLALLALLVRRGRAAMALGSVGLIGAAGAYVVVKQARNAYPPDFGWPSFFETAHILAWLALLLLLTDVLVAWARRRRHFG
ncbi:MAG TPA: alpha-(1-_3)-arabinofuranosyltransferase family protein [Acidimicrobiales bacterium]|nr:alpha-(1->3)-arabinofuranosyltransferase family protein [Acidimicrobiales bacterium]